jgi:macrolide-specific efflux system membrane fusion protein
MPSRSKTSWLAPVIAATVVIAAIILIVVFLNRPKSPQLVTQAVTLGDVEKTVLATGALEPYRQVSVGAQVSGQVVSLRVDLGDQVKAGDLIAEIDSKTQSNNLQTAQASLDNISAQKIADEATLAQKQAAFERQKTLYAADAGSKADYDAAVAELKSAQSALAAVNAQIVSATVAVNTAQVNLGYTRITAPMDGTVISIVTKQGQTVNANQSAPTIVVLGELDKMTVKAQISEADVIHVRPGMQVYFTILGDPSKKYYATLRSIEPANTAFEPDTSTTTTSTASAIYYYGLFDVDNPDGVLRTSMTAQVNIVEQSAKNTLTMPAAALGQKNKDGSYTVMVANEKGHPPEPHKVMIGVNDGSNAQVLSGLKMGDQVVVAEGASGGAASASSSDGIRRGGVMGMGGPPGGGPR